MSRRKKAVHAILTSLQKQLEYVQDEYEYLVGCGEIEHISEKHADPKLIATNMIGLLKRTFTDELEGDEITGHEIIR